MEYLNRQRIIPKFRRWTLRATVDLGFFCLQLICFWFLCFSFVFSACYHWWICLLVWLLSSFSFYYYYFFLLIILITFLFIIFVIFFPFFFPPFSSEPCGWQGLGVLAWFRPEPLRWESRVQDIGLLETSQPNIILVDESSPRDLCLSAKTQLHPTASKLWCWMPNAKQLARQEHNPTH